MPKKYLLYIHDELFDKEPKKSQLINNLLERHYHDTVGGKTQKEVHTGIRHKQSKIVLTDIPGVEKASEARCKGKHYINRVDCGKPGCPWHTT